MVYISLKDLIDGFLKETITDQRVGILLILVEVYTEAISNPPCGVIGVGALTYAEDRLIAKQRDMLRNNSMKEKG